MEDGGRYGAEQSMVPLTTLEKKFIKEIDEVECGGESLQLPYSFIVAVSTNLFALFSGE